MYKKPRRYKNELYRDAIIHPDQGVHYTSPKFQKLLKTHNLGQSMSRRGNCWDNAPQESFFGHMKDDLDFSICQTLEEVISLIDAYIEYYNNHRYQWGLKKMTPKQYRNHLLLDSFYMALFKSIILLFHHNDLLHVELFEL